MKTKHILDIGIQENVRREYLAGKEFKEDLNLQNIHKGKLLAIIVIILEVIFLSIDIASYFLRVSETFSYASYLAMYLIMIAINLIYLFLIHRYKKEKIQQNAMYAITVIFVTLIMVWGCVISLMDQRLYGQLMVFMVNMMICSIIYYLDGKGMSIPYLVSTILLVITLPYFQTTSNVLIGHYVNLVVFITISWTTSRIIYRNYCNSYIIRELMNQSNSLLEKQMRENTIMNEKLAVANAQLKKLALMDELTELPNRRSFREFMDQKISYADAAQVMSVIMIDVDYFKQYNDFYGHENGDMALIAIAGQLKDMIDSADHIAVRWGGEEFIYAAFHTSRDDIIGIANEIRLKILGLKIPNDSFATNPYLTISMGTCTAGISSAREIEKIINAADKALYQAKKNGRNCVATFAEEDGVTDADGAAGLG